MSDTRIVRAAQTLVNFAADQPRLPGDQRLIQKIAPLTKSHNDDPALRSQMERAILGEALSHVGQAPISASRRKSLAAKLQQLLDGPVMGKSTFVDRMSATTKDAVPMVGSKGTIFFDADDTLWSTQPLYAAAKEEFWALLERHGVSREEAQAAYRQIDSENFKKLGYSPSRMPTSMSQTVRRFIPGQEQAAAEKEARSIGEGVFTTKASVYPNARETLEGLRNDGWRVVMVTAGEEDVQRRRIDDSGLEDCFDGIHIVPSKNQETYEQLTALYGIRPDTAWMVGNSPRSDLAPAQAAGLRTIYTPNETWDHEKQVEASAEFVATSLGEVGIHLARNADAPVEAQSDAGAIREFIAQHEAELPHADPDARGWLESSEGIRTIQNLHEQAEDKLAATGSVGRPSLRDVPKSAQEFVVALLQAWGLQPNGSLADAFSKLDEPGQLEAVVVPAGVEVDPSMLAQFERVVEAVRSTFEEHRFILKKNRGMGSYWYDLNLRSGIASTGYCSPASEALYYLLGGKEAGLVPVVGKRYNAREGLFQTHWWLQHKDTGIRLDPTFDQFTDDAPPYPMGVPTGFQSPLKAPSKGKGELLFNAALTHLEQQGFSGDGSPKANG